MGKKQPPPQPQGIDGVFVSRKAAVIGTGTTARKSEAVAYFHARQREDGTVEMQMLGPELQDIGAATSISLDELLENYLPDPQRSLALAQARQVREGEADSLAQEGDEHRRQGRAYSAEFAYGKALELDEENVRANFGIGLCYLARSDTKRAEEVFERLVKLDAAFQNEHKHLFNEFGIQLRQAGMQAEALVYYRRALELSPDDENLHYNAARAALESGDAKLATEHLAQCLALNPRHEEGKRFLDYLKRKRLGGAA